MSGEPVNENMCPPSELDDILESKLSTNNDSTRVNYITFNQDASCVALGLSSGYRIFTCEPGILECSQGRQEESIGIIEMLYSTSLVAVTGLGQEVGTSPRKLKILNTKRSTTICDLIFPSKILSVRFSCLSMVVLLEEQIYIYDVKSMTLLHTIETSPNVNSLCALSNGNSPDQSSLLAYPSPPRTVTHESLLASGVNTNGGSHSAQNNISSVSNAPNRVGDAIIFDLVSLQPLAVIEAHKSALSAMCLSRDGILLATASDKGTIVRVFNVRTGVKLYQFRRGTYPTKIFSLSFSDNNEYIVATSSSETVHVFRLGEDELLANKQKQSRKPRAKNYTGDFENQIIEEEAEGLSLSRGRIQSSHGDSSFPISTDSMEMDKASRKVSEESESLEDEENEVNDDDDDDDDVERYIEDDGDDSDMDGEDYSDDGIMDLSKKQRKLSQGSTNSHSSLTSSFSNISGGDEHREKSEPIVDQNRLSVARLIRRSSQHLGRKAAQKMGDYLPSRFSSILEPTRHFASLKLSTIGKDVKSMAVIHDINQGGRAMYETDIETTRRKDLLNSTSISKSAPALSESTHSIRINVITSEGYYYIYGLDPVRGGDCILIHQYYLLES